MYWTQRSREVGRRRKDPLRGVSELGPYTPPGPVSVTELCLGVVAEQGEIHRKRMNETDRGTTRGYGQNSTIVLTT